MIARHARITVIALVATISCGRSREPADVSNQRDVSVVTLKAGKAHEELRKLRTLDYAYPFGDPGNTRRTRVGELFLEACKAGHRLSCGSGRDFLPGRTDFAPLLRANCVAGDVPSCRAMYPRDRTLRGGIAPDNCTQVEVPDRAGIEKECADGFPDSCFCLAMASPPVRGLSKRAWQLHLEGCALNQVGDCYTVTFDVTGTDGLWGATRWCMLGGHCWTAATMLMKRGRRIEARNLIELECQAGHAIRCGELALFYLTGDFAEPVPGRGKALFEFACKGRMDQACKLAADPTADVRFVGEHIPVRYREP